MLVIEEVIGDGYYNKCETKNKYKRWRWEFIQVLYMGRFLIFNIYICLIYIRTDFLSCVHYYTRVVYICREAKRQFIISGPKTCPATQTYSKKYRLRRHPTPLHASAFSSSERNNNNLLATATWATSPLKLKLKLKSNIF